MNQTSTKKNNQPMKTANNNPCAPLLTRARAHSRTLMHTLACAGFTLVLLVFMLNAVFAQHTATGNSGYLTGDPYSLPQGTWKVTKLEAWGGGGGGASVGRGEVGGGGAGGGYATITLDQKTHKDVTVSYSAAASVNPGTQGNSSTVSFGGKTITANGGKGASGSSGANNNSGNAGGGFTGSTGVTGKIGGKGGNGSRIDNSHTQGGGGGGGAGSSNDGSPGISGNVHHGSGLNYIAIYVEGGDGGPGVSDGGGAGGKGGRNDSGGGSSWAAEDGNGYGGGGGGGRNKGSGGRGAGGAVRITYETMYLNVTFEPNGSGVSNMPSNTTIWYYENYSTITTTTPTRTGYTFLGWYFDAAGTQPFTPNVVCEREEDFKLFAKWESQVPVISGHLQPENVNGCSADDKPTAMTTLAELQQAGLTITGGCSTVMTVHYSDAVGSSTCPIVVTRTYYVKDQCNNTSNTVTQTINIKDQTAPALASGKSWPANITGQNNCYANRDISGLYSDDQVKALFTDNCGGTITVSHTDAETATSDCGWTVTRTYTITDPCGNIYYKSGTTKPTMSVSGSDLTKPSIGTLASSALAPVAKGNCKYAIPNLQTATVNASSDGCGGTITFVSQTPTAGSEYTQDATAQYITVTVKVKDKCGNEQTKDVTVTIPAKVSVSASANPTTSCLNNSSTITATASNGTAPMSYSWTSTTGGGLSASDIANPTATPTTGGDKTYTVTVTDNNGCTDDANVTVTVNAPSVTLADMDAITVCAGDAINLNAVTSGTTVGTPSFSWTGPDGYTAIGQNPTRLGATTAMSGTYTVTASSSNTVNGVQCTSTPVSKQVTVTVNAPDAGTPVITGTSTICAGTSTTLNVSTLGETGTMSYSWDHDLGTGASKSVTPEGTTTYYVEATATVGSCTNTKTAEFTLNVNTPDAGTTTIGDVTICNGGDGTTLTASTTGNTGTMTYTWDHDLGTGASKNVNPTATTTYNVATLATHEVNSVTCSADGSALGTVTVNTPDAGTTTTGAVTISHCGHGTPLTASTTGNTGAMNYTWDHELGTGASKNVNPTATTTYNVTTLATNEVNGVTCTAEGSAQVTVTVNTPDAGTTTIGDVTICNGGDGTTLTASTTGNTGTMTYTWDHELGTGASKAVNPTATTTYNVATLATNEVNGVTCTAEGSAQVTVTVNTPNAGTTTIGDVTICNGGDGTTLTASTTGNTGTMTYTWDHDLGTGASKNVNPTATTTYNVTTLATNVVNGVTCTAEGSAQVTVTVNTPSVTLADMNAISVCAGDDINLAAIISGASVGDVTYSWAGPDGYTSSDQSTTRSNATVAMSGDYTVTATATKTLNEVQCAATDIKTVTVTVNPLPTLSVTPNDMLCNDGNTGKLAVTVGGTTPDYKIYLGDVSNDNLKSTLTAAGSYNITGLGMGSYTVTVQDGHGCQTTQTDIPIGRPDALTATAAVTPVTCNGAGNGSIEISASNGTPSYNYKLNDGNYQMGNTFSNLSPGTYVVTVQDANECTYDVTGIVIKQPDELKIVPEEITPVTCNGDGDGQFKFKLKGGNTNFVVTVMKDSESYTYTESNGVYTVSALDGGTYTVTVTDNKNCTASKDFVVDEPDELVIDYFITTKESCYPANDGTAEVIVSGGNGGYEFEWSGENGQYSSSSQKAEHLHSHRDNYSGAYYVTVTDAKGCQVEDGKNIQLDNILDMRPIVYPNTVTVCSGNEFVITPTEGIPEGNVPTFYTWTTPSVASCIYDGAEENTDPSPVISGTLYSNCPGSSIATYSVTPRYGVCVGNPQTMAITVEVNVNPGVTVTIPPAMTKKSCDPPFKIPASFTNNLTAYTTTWKRRVGTDETTETVVATHTHAAGDTCNLTVDLDDNTCAGTYYYFVEYTGTNAVGCTDASDACVVTVNAGTWNVPDPGQGNVECVSAATPLALDLTANPVVLDTRFPEVKDGCDRTITDIEYLGKEIETVNTCESKVTHTYKFTACDGTSQNWTYIYNVKDLTRPTIASDVITAKPADIDQTQCKFTIPDLTADVRGKSSDNCITTADHLIITQDPVEGTVITAATDVVVTVKDSCDNQATTTINVTVPTLPVATITAENTTHVACHGKSTGGATVTVTNGTAEFEYLWSNGQTSQTAQNLAAGSYTVTVTDANGCKNTDASVTITEPDALHIVECPDNVTVNTDNGQNYATVELPVPTFSPADNNATITNITNKAVDNHYPIGTTTITYTITNDCDESVTCSFDVIVGDDQDPVITCAVTGDQSVTPNTEGNIYTHSGDSWDATATDNVGVTSLTYSLSGATSAVVGGNTSLDGQTFNYGTTTVTWTAKDAANHTETCTFNVVVADNTPPTITCVATEDQNVTVNTENDIYTHSGTTWNATATDNVGVTSLTYSLSGATVLADDAANTSLANQTFNIGETTVTWTAKDAVGNHSECSFKVIVKSGLTITANSHEWDYDGENHTDPGFVVTTTTHTSNISGTSGTALTLPNGDQITATITGTAHNAGTVANVVGDVTIMRGEEDVTQYYNIVVKNNGVLTVKPTVVVVPTPATHICSGNTYTVEFDASIAGTNGTITYAWSRNNTTNVTGNEGGTVNSNISVELTNTQTTNQTVVFTVTPTFTSTDGNTTIVGPAKEISVIVWPALVVSDITGGGTYCLGATVTLTETPQYGSGSYNIVWKNGNNTLQTDNGVTTSSYTPSTATSGSSETYTVQVADAACPEQGGSKEVEVKVYEAMSATAEASDQAYCQSATPSLSATVTSTSHNTENVSYRWYSKGSDGTYTEIAGETGAANPFVSGSHDPGDHTYAVKVSDGCTTTDYIDVTYHVYELPTITVTENQTFNYCKDETATALSVQVA
ncbi:MAG: InlB B-repeat-containing protein, partial [Bacteroidales bacterium]|nr:InlB B-repeat-containing protein [Bacteroidales bacterium]